MKRIRNLVQKLLLAGFLCGTSLHVVADETLRPEVGKPLQAAQELLKSQKYKDALAKVKEAEAVANRTAYENFIIERMRAAAATGAGDTETAAKAFEAVIAVGKLSAGEQLKMMEAVAGTYYRAKDYAKAMAWAQRYFKEGGTNSQIRTLLIQAQYLSGDYAGAAKELSAELAADDKAGQAIPEERLQLLANCNLKLKDYAGYANTLEHLVSQYPKKEYWADLIGRIQRKPGFSDRMSLDVYRLQHATGNLRETGDYMEMSQLALQAGLPSEAKKIVDEGFGRGALGSGSDAERHKRLRDLANKQATEDQKALPQNEAQAAQGADGNALVNVGYAFVMNGLVDKGISLMEKGIEKGGLKRSEDAKLHLGMAYLRSSNRAKGIQVLRTVQGTDGSADIARLWVILSQRL